MFVTLTLRNGMEFRYPKLHINSVNNASVSCTNFVNFGLVSAELTELICERLAKNGVFSGISPDILDLFSQTFHHMKALLV